MVDLITRSQLRAGFSAAVRKEQAMRAIVRAVSGGLGKDGVTVCGHANVTRGASYRPVPHLTLLRLLAKETTLVIMNEHLTSASCAHCRDGTRMKPGPGNKVS